MDKDDSLQYHCENSLGNPFVEGDSLMYLLKSTVDLPHDLTQGSYLALTSLEKVDSFP